MSARWKHLRENWAVHSYYQRFESSVALVLTLIIALIVLVALYQLAANMTAALLFGVLDPLDHKVFQLVFGDIMTLLIALEFNHTLQFVVTGQQGIIHTKMVILIALLALARKVIILDLYATSAASLIALALLTLALGVTYWLMRERDDRAKRALDDAV